jgi:hypothetical protein
MMMLVALLALPLLLLLRSPRQREVPAASGRPAAAPAGADD